MYRNKVTLSTIDTIVRFIPIRKLRDSIRNILVTFFDTYRRINILNQKANYIIAKLDKVEKKDYISILATVKNEAPYLVEWIEYHKLIGVDRFYIYDNDSTDNIKDVLKDYIEDGTVVYNDSFHGFGKQLYIYEDAINRYGMNTFWMAIIDLDEFIVPVEKFYLKDFLKDYESYPALVCNWVMYDGNDHVKKPDGLVIENYKRAISKNNAQNKIVKSIVRPEYVIEYFSAHNFDYFNSFAVDEDFKPVHEVESSNGTLENKTNKIRINHYYTKSLEEYESKISKRDNNGIVKRSMSLYKSEDTYIDNIMDKYIDTLKNILSSKK